MYAKLKNTIKMRIHSTLSHPDDNWSGDMIFNDVVKLTPKSRLAEEHKAHVNAISCVYLEVLDTTCCMSARSVSIANYSEPANFSKNDDGS